MKLIKKLLKWLVIGIVAIIVLAVVFGGSGDKDTETASPTAQPTKVAVTQSTTKPKATNTPEPASGQTMYFCGFDPCKGSLDYGKLIFPTGINVWNNPDPDRGGVHHKASNGDRVTVIETKRVGSGPGGLWFKLEGGGWTNGLWLTDELCTEQNLAEYTLDDC